MQLYKVRYTADSVHRNSISGIFVFDSKEEKLDNVLKGIDFGADYVLVYKDLDNVLDDIDFANDTERLLTQSIIRSLEEEASKQFVKELAVDIPYIGTAQRNLLRKKVVESYQELKEARNTLPIEEYKKFRDELIIQKKAEVNAIEVERRLKKADRNRNYKLWVKLSRKYGIAYANCYLQFHKQLKVVEFDEELNNAYIDAWS